MVREIKDTRQQVRNFLEENFLFGRQDDLKDGDSFLDGGILDSTGILQLIAFLGETYGITVEDEEVTPDNLDSIDKIAAYLNRKWNSL
jgi:acyl carrier protein